MRRRIAVSLQGYNRSWLSADVMAGLTLVAIAIPEQIATAKLANMPTVTGLWAFVAGSVLIALVGRSPRLSVGADSTIAPVLAAAVVGVAAGSHTAELTSFLTLGVGVVVLAAGLLRLGWIADFLSAPVITGVLGGIGIEIIVRQLPVVLGVAGGGTTTVDRVRHVAHELGSVNGWALLIAAVVLVTIIGLERVDRRMPGALVGVTLSTVLVAVAGAGRLSIAVLGSIPSGAPVFALPSATFDQARHLLPACLTVAFLCLAQTAATQRSAAGTAETSDLNGDLVGVGAGSMLAGFAGSFAVNSSPPRTAVVVEAGGRTQATSLVAALVVVAVLVVGTGAVRNVPEAALGATLIFVGTNLLRPGEFRTIARFSQVEFALAVVSLATVALFGIEPGIVVAIALSLLDRTRRAARPSDVLLGREPGTDHWIPTDIGRPTEQVPGVLVWLLYSALWYGNADYVRRRIRQLVAGAPSDVRVFIFDANGVSDIDYTGARALGAILTELDQDGVKTGIARASHLVHHDLKHSGLLAQLGEGRIFLTVADAVETLAA